MKKKVLTKGVVKLLVELTGYQVKWVRSGLVDISAGNARLTQLICAEKFLD